MSLDGLHEVRSMDSLINWVELDAKLVRLGTNPEYVAEVIVAWDRDWPDKHVEGIRMFEWSNGMKLVWAVVDHDLCVDWCHLHRRWEFVKNRAPGCCRPWTPHDTWPREAPWP